MWLARLRYSYLRSEAIIRKTPNSFWSDHDTEPVSMTSLSRSCATSRLEPWTDTHTHSNPRCACAPRVNHQCMMDQTYTLYYQCLFNYIHTSHEQEDVIMWTGKNINLQRHSLESIPTLSTSIITVVLAVLAGNHLIHSLWCSRR